MNPQAFAFGFMLVAAVGLANITKQPVASFTVGCQPGSRQCLFDATKSSGAAVYVWTWGNGRSEIHTTPTASNTFQPGAYCVTLTVTDLVGVRVSKGVILQLPWVSGTPLYPCLSVQPDTVTIPGRVDTLRIVRVDTVASKPDTVQLPGRVDTLRLVAPAPTQPTGRYIIQPAPTEYWVYDGSVLKGILVPIDITRNTWQAYRYTPGQLLMPCLGTPANMCNIYNSQALARDALP